MVFKLKIMRAALFFLNWKYGCLLQQVTNEEEEVIATGMMVAYCKTAI